MAAKARIQRIDQSEAPTDRAVDSVHRALQLAYASDIALSQSSQAVTAAGIREGALRDQSRDAYDLAAAQVRIAQHEIVAAVRQEMVTVGDGLRALASLPTHVSPDISQTQQYQAAEARVEVVNNLINTGDGEPAILILPSGQSLVFPGDTIITPYTREGTAGMAISYADTERPGTFLPFADLAVFAREGIVASEVISGRRAIGEFLHKDEVLSGAQVTSDTRHFNQVRLTVQLLGSLAETRSDLTDFGFRQPEVDHLTRLWMDLATQNNPVGRAVSLPELVRALPVIDRQNAMDIILMSLENMGNQFFERAAQGGVGFTAYRERLLELYQLVHGELDEAGRVEALRTIGHSALIAHGTPDTV